MCIALAEATLTVDSCALEESVAEEGGMVAGLPPPSQPPGLLLLLLAGQCEQTV